jgi:hypothetical protein
LVVFVDGFRYSEPEQYKRQRSDASQAKEGSELDVKGTSTPKLSNMLGTQKKAPERISGVVAFDSDALWAAHVSVRR